MKKDLIKILNYYGIDNQIKIYNQKTYELNNEFIKYKESKRNPIDIIFNSLEPVITLLNNKDVIDKKQKIKSNLTDVMVIIKQIQYYYEIDDNELINLMKTKIKEQISDVVNSGKEVSNNEKSLQE